MASTTVERPLSTTNKRAGRRATAAAAAEAASKINAPTPVGFTMTLADVRTFFAGHLTTAGKDELLPVFRHVLVTVTGGAITAFTTDRYRMTETTIAPKGERASVGGLGEFLVHVDQVKRVLGALPKGAKTKAFPVTFFVDAGKLVVKTYDTDIIVPVDTSGLEFPKVTHLLDAHDDGAVEFLAFNPSHLGDLCDMPHDRNTSLVLRSKGKARPAGASWTVDGAIDYRHLIMQMRVAD